MLIISCGQMQTEAHDLKGVLLFRHLKLVDKILKV